MINKNVAMQHYGVDNEKDLRSKITGERAGITFEETNALFEHLSNFKEPTYAEIGVYFGGTFSNVLNFLKHNKQKYHAYGFDLFEDLSKEKFGKEQTHDIKNKWNILNVAYKSELEKILTDRGYKNFTLCKGNSNEVVSNLDITVDVALIDGNHTYNQTKLDFEAVYSKSKKGTIIIFDNSSNNIQPDPRYVELDGGPWKVCQELKEDERVEFIKLVHRCSYFEVLK